MLILKDILYLIPKYSDNSGYQLVLEFNENQLLRFDLPRSKYDFIRINKTNIYKNEVLNLRVKSIHYNESIEAYIIKIKEYIK